MILAESKRQKNISEYIIYMYQTEDLIRIYDFDMEKVQEYVIKHIPVDDKSELVSWYKTIAKQMKKEGIKEKGHLSSVQQLVEELSKMKDELLESDKEFIKIYENSVPHIKKSLEYAEGQVKDEIQACLNGIYGLLLLKMNGKNIHPDLMDSINAFGDVLSYLSYKYKQKHFMNEN